MNTAPRTPVARQATDEGRTPEPTRTGHWGDFLILPENRAAARACRAVAKAVLAGRRSSFNPLVLHGPPGTGKTHLSATLLRALAAGSEGATGRSVSAGDVARSTDDAAGFADPDLLACDVLVLEDVQHLPPRAADPVC